MQIIFDQTNKATVELTRKQALTLIKEIDDKITELKQIRSELVHALRKEENK